MTDPLTLAMSNGKVDLLPREIDVVHADTRRSISGWASAKRPSRCTSHLAAKSGDVLTVPVPTMASSASRPSRAAIPTDAEQ
jgi:hypothetical protein